MAYYFFSPIMSRELTMHTKLYNIWQSVHFPPLISDLWHEI